MGLSQGDMIEIFDWVRGPTFFSTSGGEWKTPISQGFHQKARTTPSTNRLLAFPSIMLSFILALAWILSVSMKWEVWMRLLSIPLTINRLNSFDNYIMHYQGRAAPLPTINATDSSIERAEHTALGLCLTSYTMCVRAGHWLEWIY